MIAVLQYPEEENPDDFKAKVLLSSRKYGYALRSYMQTNVILHTDAATVYQCQYCLIPAHNNFEKFL